MTGGLRVRVHTPDPVRRQGLKAMLETANHTLTDEAPDVELCDQPSASTGVTPEFEAPVLALASGMPSGDPAGILHLDATTAQLDAALRAVSVGLIVRTADVAPMKGFAPIEDLPLLTPREREILGLIGEGLSNKGIARRLQISAHTVKFHIEALFAKLDVTSRAKAVVKGLRGGVIEM